ncbi:hypothetical protein WG66_008480 [Moniliophthora roreri]|nr:hypothetical protein WG66_008480 [Moniliophthora roreri]
MLGLCTAHQEENSIRPFAEDFDDTVQVSLSMSSLKPCITRIDERLYPQAFNKGLTPLDFTQNVSLKIEQESSMTRILGFRRPRSSRYRHFSQSPAFSYHQVQLPPAFKLFGGNL